MTMLHSKIRDAPDRKPQHANSRRQFQETLLTLIQGNLHLKQINLETGLKPTHPAQTLQHPSWSW